MDDGNGTWSGLVGQLQRRVSINGKTEVPSNVRNSKVRKQDKFSSIGLDIKTHARPKVGQDQKSGGVSVFCWHAAPVANVLWKPHTIR